MKKIVIVLALAACASSFAKKTLDEPSNPPVKTTKKK